MGVGVGAGLGLGFDNVSIVAGVMHPGAERQLGCGGFLGCIPLIGGAGLRFLQLEGGVAGTWGFVPGTTSALHQAASLNPVISVWQSMDALPICYRCSSAAHSENSCCHTLFKDAWRADGSNCSLKLQNEVATFGIHMAGMWPALA